MIRGRAGTGPDGIVVGLCLLASIALVWFVADDPLISAVYLGALLVLGGMLLVLNRRHPVAAEPEYALPDWSVTVEAIDRQDIAIAITDRAGRLACANSAFESWFGVAQPPPRLPVDRPSLDRLAEAVRSAWRDGQAELEIAGEGEDEREGERWQVELRRSGRGEDFLLWRFSALRPVDLVEDMAGRLAGKLGRALSYAGISAAVVDPEGFILGASAGFVQRSVGDPAADLTGQDFVALLSQDEDDRIFWVRDALHEAPLTLYHVPVLDPDQEGGDPATAPSLMLVVDARLGIGVGEVASAASPHLEALLGQLPLGLAMCDRDGRVLFANPAFMRAAGREGQEPPTYPTDLVVKEDKRVLSETIRRFAQGPATAGDIAIRLPDQPDEPVSLSIAGVRGLGDAAVLLGLTDSTEEIRLKRQILQATKMQAVGQLAGGVAHDFNNVLTAILGTCDLMLMRHTPGDSDYDDIQQIRANSNRAASLTRQLLAFSRQQTLRPEVLQLPDVLADVSHLLRRLIGEKIELVVTHDRDLGPVRADPTQVEQVIVNLAVNARDAMQARGDGSGRLTLATRRVTAAQVRAMRSEIMPAIEYTALVVEDTGGGIPPENLGKIFEPFFTTKEQGKGTGLGLSTVYGIVKQSNGFIFAESEVGRGTRFTVYLPVHHAAPGSALAPSAEPVEETQSQWAGGGRILLVEDEDPVRMVAERALTRQGYKVTSARNGEEGLELVQHGGAFDLVVSDVVMPMLDGPAMAREIRKIAPALPVLFMSGYAETQLRQEIGLANAWFMPKPFSVQQLSEKVAEVLARTATAAASRPPS